MIREGKFGPGEAIILLGVTSIARIFLSYPRSLVEIAGAAAWMTPLGGLILILGGIYILSLVLKKSPGNTLVEINELAFGPVLGLAVNILFIVMVLELIGALFIREFSEAMLTTTVRNAPLGVIFTGFAAAGFLGAYLGIEALARTARLTYPHVMLSIVILILTLIPFWNFHNLLPIFGKGAAQTFFIGSLSTAGIIEITVAGVIVQSMGGTGTFAGIGYRAMLLGYSILAAILLTLLLTYNWPVSEEFTLPFLRLARTIYLGAFFQRLESIYILVWGVVGSMKIALILYGAAAALARTLRLPDYRPLLWPLALIMFVLGLLPPDMPTTTMLDEDYVRYFVLVPGYLLPLMVSVVFWFKGRGERAGG